MFIDNELSRARNILQHYGGVSRDVANLAIGKLTPDQIDLINKAEKKDHRNVARATLEVLELIPKAEVEPALATPEQPPPVETGDLESSKETETTE